MDEELKRIIVVGSGSAGMVAAIAAKEAGLDPVVLESNNKSEDPLPCPAGACGFRTTHS